MWLWYKVRKLYWNPCGRFRTLLLLFWLLLFADASVVIHFYFLLFSVFSLLFGRFAFQSTGHFITACIATLNWRNMNRTDVIHAKSVIASIVIAWEGTCIAWLSLIFVSVKLNIRSLHRWNPNMVAVFAEKTPWCRYGFSAIQHFNSTTLFDGPFFMFVDHTSSVHHLAGSVVSRNNIHLALGKLLHFNIHLYILTHTAISSSKIHSVFIVQYTLAAATLLQIHGVHVALSFAFLVAFVSI